MAIFLKNEKELDDEYSFIVLRIVPVSGLSPQNNSVSCAALACHLPLDGGVSAEEFIHRFLQHVHPKGFAKVRYDGLFSPGLRAQLAALPIMWPNDAKPEAFPRSCRQTTLNFRSPTCYVYHPVFSVGAS
jgi:hypothetical protein